MAVPNGRAIDLPVDPAPRGEAARGGWKVVPHGCRASDRAQDDRRTRGQALRRVEPRLVKWAVGRDGDGRVHGELPEVLLLRHGDGVEAGEADESDADGHQAVLDQALAQLTPGG